MFFLVDVIFFWFFVWLVCMSLIDLILGLGVFFFKGGRYSRVRSWLSGGYRVIFWGFLYFIFVLKLLE